MTYINLVATFGDRFRITWDQAYDPTHVPIGKRDPWMMQMYRPRCDDLSLRREHVGRGSGPAPKHRRPAHCAGSAVAPGRGHREDLPVRRQPVRGGGRD